MSKEKQIEEMAKDLQETHDYDGCEAWHCGGCEYEKYGKNYMCSSIKQAEKMTAKGYRKQSEGEWTKHIDEWDCEYVKCSCCGEELYDSDGDTIDRFYNFCPNCGAKMKEGSK